jgi:hypothetical protein
MAKRLPIVGCSSSRSEIFEKEKVNAVKQGFWNARPVFDAQRHKPFKFANKHVVSGVVILLQKKCVAGGCYQSRSIIDAPPAYGI